MRKAEQQRELVARTQALGLDGELRATALPFLHAVRHDAPTALQCALYTPTLCLVLQGEKETTVGGASFRFRAGQCLVVPVTVPVTARVVRATKEAPFLCLVVDLDPDLVFALLRELGPGAPAAPPSRGPLLESAPPEVLETVLRLLRCLDREVECRILAPQLLREILFRLLVSPHGEAVRQLGVATSHARRVARAIEKLRADFHRPLRMEELARSVAMSPSAFFRHFKAVTTLSPLQYQKALRLQEARRLLGAEGGDAASVAFRVGYESPSQFSREYARLFGLPPMADARRLRDEAVAPAPRRRARGERLRA